MVAELMAGCHGMPEPRSYKSMLTPPMKVAFGMG